MIGEVKKEICKIEGRICLKSFKKIPINDIKVIKNNIENIKFKDAANNFKR